MNEALRFKLPRSASVPSNNQPPLFERGFPAKTLGKRRGDGPPPLSSFSRVHPNRHPTKRQMVAPSEPMHSPPPFPPPPPSPLASAPLPSPPTIFPCFALDYHLSMPVVIDNPKKLPKFDFIRVVPKGQEFAVYFQHNTWSFFPRTSATPAATIPQQQLPCNNLAPLRRAMFFCTMVKPSFFVITDLVFLGDKYLVTNAERMSGLTLLFQHHQLHVVPRKNKDAPHRLSQPSSVIDPRFEEITFHPTHVFAEWTDFAKGSLHIPYEIKHLEYCFYKEHVLKQSLRFIYILNKKANKKGTHDTNLVYTIGKGESPIRNEPSIGTSANHPRKEQDFKTCVLTNTPYTNLEGFSHLDKQEESDSDA